MYRGTVFRENAAIVAAHNARGASFTMTLNRFADMSNEEFANRFARGRVAAQRTLRGSKMSVFTAPVKDVPAAWDWVSKGKVHSVTNQVRSARSARACPCMCVCVCARATCA